MSAGMSTIDIRLRLTFEDTIDPGETDTIRDKFDHHIDTLLDLGFLTRFGTIYDYEVTAEYDADDDHHA